MSNLSHHIERLADLRDTIARRISLRLENGGELEPGPLEWNPKEKTVREKEK